MAHCASDEAKMGFRQLRKIEGLSNETEHVYECDSCAWVVHVGPDRHIAEVQMEFDEHRCEKFSFGMKLRS
jgi:hypothetical protein